MMLKRIFLLLPLCLAAVPLSGYQNAIPVHQGPVSAEGEIVEISVLPEARKLEYPDCLFSACVQLNSVADDVEIPRCITVSFYGYRNKRLCREGNYRKGMKLALQLIPMDEVSEEIRQTCVVDTLTQINADWYFAVKSNVIPSFTPVEIPCRFTEESAYKSAFASSLNPPLPAEIIKARNERIAGRLREIDAQLEQFPQPKIEQLQYRYLRDFQEYKNTHTPHRKSDSHHYDLYVDKYGEMDLELAEYASGIFSVGESDQQKAALGAIAALNEFFKAQNILFTVVIVPGLYQISARGFFPQYRQYPIFPELFLEKALLDNDIDVINLSPLLLAELGKPRTVLFNYHNHDHHPGSGTTEIAGREIADRLRDYAVSGTIDRTHFSVEEASFDTGLWWQKAGGAAKLYYRVPQLDGKQIEVYPADSEVLMLGNSYTRSPQTASFPQWTAYYSGVVPLLLKVEGQGIGGTIPRYLLMNRERYVNGKKAAFLILTKGFLNYSWINIRDFDRHLEKFSKMEAVRRIAAGDLAITGKIKALTPQEYAQWHCENRLHGSGRFFKNEGNDARIRIPHLRKGEIVQIPLYSSDQCALQFDKTHCHTSIGVSVAILECPEDDAEISIHSGVVIGLGDITIYR